MTKKTESLSFPSDPLATMRQLQDLDAPSNDTPPGPPQERDRVTTLPGTHVTSHETPSVATLAVTSRGGNEVTKPPTGKQSRREPAQAEQERDSISVAVREYLARPYTNEAGKGPMSACTVKMPSEVWERLGWAAKLTGQAKQDIIRDALKDYFRKLLKEL
jgi:hypothetical protein